jgi:hypothetical protein
MSSFGWTTYAVEHLLPKSDPNYANRECDYNNLVYACMDCNSWKGVDKGVIDPCVDYFGRHLRVKDDGAIEGLTDEGWILIDVLRLDRRTLTSFRKGLLEYQAACADHPGSRVAALLNYYMCYPDELPDLEACRVPNNTRPEGLKQTYFALRERGELPATY